MPPAPSADPMSALPDHISNLVELFHLEANGEAVTWTLGRDAAYRTIVGFFAELASDIEEHNAQVLGVSAPTNSDTAASVDDATSVAAPTEDYAGAVCTQPSSNMGPIAPHLLDAIKELIELEDAGDSVIFPLGLSSASARQLCASASSV
jgi:hypothetical protein